MLSVRTASFPLRITTAWGTLTSREYLEVRLDFPDGTHGLGEAAPLEPYDGVSLAATRAALDAYGQIRGAARDAARSLQTASATSPRRWRPSTSRSGIAPPASRRPRSRG